MDNIHYVRQPEVFDTIINHGVPFVKVKGLRSDLVYGKDSDNCVIMVRCIPHAEYLLFEVGGTYAKSKPLVYNRFLAKSRQEAKERYKNLYGWNATECRYIPPSKEAEEILTNPLRMPI